MTKFYYSVTVTAPNHETAVRFEAWLVNGHIADVIKGGAESGRVIRLEAGDTGSIRLETQYIFADRAAYQAYCDGPAIALRAEGVEKFGNAGVLFERRTGEIAFDTRPA